MLRGCNFCLLHIYICLFRCIFATYYLWTKFEQREFRCLQIKLVGAKPFFKCEHFICAQKIMSLALHIIYILIIFPWHILVINWSTRLANGYHWSINMWCHPSVNLGTLSNINSSKIEFLVKFRKIPTWK